MDRSQIRLMLVATMVAWTGSCQVYQPAPLEPAATLRSVEEERHRPTAPGVNLAQAAQWMRTQGPEVQEAIAAYRTALARARIPTPWPNPGIEVGPEFGFGSDVTVNPVAPFGSLSLTIPLSNRLAREDERNQARAETLRIAALARHRELYLELRRRYLRYIVVREIQVARNSLLESSRQSIVGVRRLVEAGQATALDVALFDLEQGRARVESLAAEAAAAAAQADLADLVGIQASHFESLPINALPEVPVQIPELARLKAQLTDHHPELGRLRARYTEAECDLHLEVAKQFPDLRIGPSGAGETGDRKSVLGLSLGIDLPLFDRNDQGIAEARAHREEIRVQYEATANRALAALERAHRSVALATKHHEVLRDIVLPQTQDSIQLARRTLAAGSGDASRLLHAERSFGQVLIEVLEGRLAEREAWIDLELALGMPLLRFPGDGPDPVGTSIPDLEAVDSNEGES